MPKSKGRKLKPQGKSNQETSLKDPKKSGHPSPRGRARVIVEWFLGVSTVLGLVLAALTFFPRVSVTPNSSEASNTAPTLFLITNVGYLPLWDIRPALGVCEISYNETPKSPNTDPSGCTPSDEIMSFLVYAPWKRDKLEADDKYTIAVQDMLRPTTPLPFGYTDFSISINYRPWFLPWRQTRAFRFFTKLEGDGKLYWFAK